MLSIKFTVFSLLLIAITAEYSQARSVRDELQFQESSLYKKAEEYFKAIQDFLDPSKLIADALNDKKVEERLLKIADDYYDQLYDAIKTAVDAAYGIRKEHTISDEDLKRISKFIESHAPKLREKLSEPHNKEKVLKAMHENFYRSVKSFREKVVETVKQEKIKNAEEFHKALERLKTNVDIFRNEIERLAQIPHEVSKADSSSFVGTLVSKIEKEKEELGRAFQGLLGSFKATYEEFKDRLFVNPFGGSLEDFINHSAINMVSQIQSV